MVDLQRFLRSAAAAAVIVVAGVGCESTAKREAYLDEFRSRGVAGPVYVKVERERRLTLEDVVHLKRRGVPEGVIAEQIERSDSRFFVSTKDVDRLRAARASDQLIDFIISTGEGYAVGSTAVYGAYPAYPYLHGGYHGFGYPYRPYYGIGVHHDSYRGHYHHGHHRHDRREHRRPAYPHERIRERVRRL